MKDAGEIEIEAEQQRQTVIIINIIINITNNQQALLAYQE